MREPEAIGYLVNEEDKIKFVKDSQGNLRIYEWPGQHCVIGADVAEGIDADESTAIVLGCEVNATMAAYNSAKIDPDEFAEFLNNLGRFYYRSFNVGIEENNVGLTMPLIGVERNSVGFSVVSDLLHLYDRRHIYFHYRYDERTKVKTKKFGWITNQHTRHLMLGYLKQEIREDSTELYDKPLIQQCTQFVNVDGKPKATEGEKDDLVIARAIAGMMKRERPVRIVKHYQELSQAPKLY